MLPKETKITAVAPIMSLQPRDVCPFCVKNEQNSSALGAKERNIHYLRFAADYGLDELRRHLDDWVNQWFGMRHDLARESIGSIMTWVADTIKIWSQQLRPKGRSL